MMPGLANRDRIVVIDATAQACVKNGRLVLDEPTELPEGAIVYLQRVDNDLDEADRAELRRELEASIAEADVGDTAPLGEVLAALRARP